MKRTKIIDPDVAKVKSLGEEISKIKLRVIRKKLIVKMKTYIKRSNRKYPLWITGFGNAWNLTVEECERLVQFLEGL